MKLVESQLLASLAAANARSDAAALRAQRLAAALETAGAKLAQQQQQQQQCFDGTADGCGVGADLALQVSQLTAQAASRSQETYRLQDQLLQSKQVRYGSTCYVECVLPWAGYISSLVPCDTLVDTQSIPHLAPRWKYLNQ
jgi:hypothetical protein